MSMLANTCLTLLLGQEQTLGEKMIEAMTVLLIGMGIVFLSLLIIGEIIGLMGRLAQRGPAEQPGAAASSAVGPAVTPVAPSEAPTPSEPVVPGGIDGRTLALITAAAFAVVRRPLRVRRVTFLNQNTISAWAEIGRVSVQTSHNLRR